MQGSRIALSGAGYVAVLAAMAFLSASASAQERLQTQAGPIAVETQASGLDHPWGMAFLPDGRLLVTERPGRLRILSRDGKLTDPLGGTPEVFASGQGGLLDVALDPEFASNRMVWLSFAEAGQDGASTALGRGRLAEGRIEDFRTIFRQQPKVSGDKHFGGRIAFSADGQHVFLTMGERFKFDPAQDVSNHLGTIVRLARDGSVPRDNPLTGREEAAPEIWSWGHRNVEAAAIHPETGELWAAEMGPRGGDELNLIQRGRNYGWPIVSWGEHYDGRDIPDPPTRPEFADVVKHWTPVISPSGMTFYTGEAFPAWRGSVLIGSLSDRAVVRVMLAKHEATGEERIPLGARIRDVEQGPDGSIYVLTDEDDGEIRRLSPAS